MSGSVTPALFLGSARMQYQQQIAPAMAIAPQSEHWFLTGFAPPYDAGGMTVPLTTGISRYSPARLIAPGCTAGAVNHRSKSGGSPGTKPSLPS